VYHHHLQFNLLFFAHFRFIQNKEMKIENTHKCWNA
jgi:hypothetical protein